MGDVHGCAAHLDALLGRLGPVVARAADAGRRCMLVMIGDYVDRGPDSLGVLDRLGGLEAALGVPVHLLLGNHDQFLREALRIMPDPGVLELWCENGGDTTLAECGIERVAIEGADPAAIAARLRAALGPARIRLLRGLAPGWRADGYLFVHAGVDPTRPLRSHGLDELIWIREPFLSGQGWRHPFAVVHGHTPFGPEVLPHRVGTDSGCFRTGVLTAVELADDRLRFHGVSSVPDLRAFQDGLDSSQPRAFGTPQPIGA